MNKKTIFDKHLYKEGMRSLLPFGAIFLGLLCVFSTLYSISKSFNAVNQSVYLHDQFASLSTEFSFLYFFIIIAITPVLTLRIFSFLTTRSGSDFYHAIPHKKQCIYLSYSLAVCTWILLCTVIPSSIGYIIFSIAGSNAMPFGMLIISILHILVAALLVLSAISIALTVTGTMLATIVTTGLILFFPRLFIYGCRLIVCVITNRLILGNGFFFGTRCNIVVQSFINLEYYNSYLFSFGPLMYTLILSILYIMLAMFLFNRRPSELAMKSALSKKFQAGICLLIGTAFSLIPIALICNTLRYEDRIVTTDFIFSLFTIYILIIIGMGAYEVLSTKKVRNLLRIIPRTGILMAINILMFFGLQGTKSLVTSYVPNSSDIKSVSFVFNNPNYAEIFNNDLSFDTLFSIGNPSAYYDDHDYFTSKLNAYSTSNETVRNIVANALKNPISNEANIKYRIGVTVNTGIRQITRSLYISDKDYEALQNQLLSDEAFTSIYTDLPTITKRQISVIDNINCSNITGDTVSLYETMREEIAALGTAKYLKLMENYNDDSIGSILFGESVGSQYVIGKISINTTLPKTYQKYVELVNANNKDAIKNFRQTVGTGKSKKPYSIIEFGPVYSSSMSYVQNSQTLWMEDTVPEVYDAFINSVISVENNPIDTSKKGCNLIAVCLRHANNSGYSETTTIKFVQLDNETYSKLSNDIKKFDALDIPED